jgi:hypothetical protein
MADSASDSGAGDAMMARLMSDHASNRRAFEASGRGSGKHTDWCHQQGRPEYEK